MHGAGFTVPSIVKNVVAESFASPAYGAHREIQSYMDCRYDALPKTAQNDSHQQLFGEIKA